ncbi:hypothetical protein [Brevundimonas sp. TWP3-1-2b1]|uniref:hypothetical protein n=1 Tax=Brevundimonas sp. TWP3-1-2b1 TaxID=2804650 RepID=UPI003CED66DD
MARPNKRGFIPPQPAAALSSLDFAAASQAFDRAQALVEKDGNTDEQVRAALFAAKDFADKLLGLPTHDPVQIGQKIAAYEWLHGDSPGLLTDPAVRKWVASNGKDASKGLLAIYLDLTAKRLDPNADYISRATAALELERRAIAGDRVAEADADEPVSAAINEADALPATPENIGAKLMGLRLIYENSGGFDELEDATTDCRLMRDIMKALLTQAGGPHPDALNPCIWVHKVARETGGTVEVVGDALRISFDDGGLQDGAMAKAEAMWEALSPQQKLVVRDWLSDRREAA